MLIKSMIKVAIEHCKTQLAATKRSGDIFKCVLRNHTPIDSVRIKITIAIPIWIVTEVENIF